MSENKKQDIKKILHQEKTFKCPKCGFRQDPSDSCIKCGIIFSKYKEILRKREERAKVLKEAEDKKRSKELFKATSFHHNQRDFLQAQKKSE